MKVITFIVAAAISAFLFTTAVDKLLHWELFVLMLGKNPLIPVAWAGAVGGGVIAVEAGIAALCLPGATRRRGLVCAAALFALFTVIVAILLWRAPAAQCGCSFVAGFDRPTLRHLLLNVLLMVLCGFTVRTGFNPSPTPTGVRAPAAPAATPSLITDQRSAS